MSPVRTESYYTNVSLPTDDKVCGDLFFFERVPEDGTYVL